ncbi:hypothetical protein K435DRAFT_879671, partial [Dendrothele bispora CBS 962.96]
MSVSSTTDNASFNSARPRATLTTANVGEDDDEPPICGYTHARNTSKPEEIPVRTLEPVSPPAENDPPVAYESFAEGYDAAGNTLETGNKFSFRHIGSWFRSISSQAAGPTPTYKQSLIASARYTPLNVCLLFIPVSWALHFTHQSPTLIFVFSALGIIPLAALL